jgi:hypothetical protein
LQYFFLKMLWLGYYYHHQSSVTALHIEDNSWRTPCVVLYSIQLLQQLQVQSSLVSFTKIICVHSNRCLHGLHQFQKKAGWERDKRVASLQSAQTLVQRKPQLHFIALVLQQYSLRNGSTCSIMFGLQCHKSKNESRPKHSRFQKLERNAHLWNQGLQ